MKQTYKTPTLTILKNIKQATLGNADSGVSDGGGSENGSAGYES